MELPEIWTREPGRVPEVRKKNYAFTIRILYATFFSSLSIVFMLARFRFIALVCMVLTIVYVMLFVLILKNIWPGLTRLISLDTVTRHRGF